MTPMESATLAVYDKIGALFPGQAGQNVAQEVATAAVMAWIAAVAPQAVRHGTPCCGSTVGHFPSCTANGARP